MDQKKAMMFALQNIKKLANDKMIENLKKKLSSKSVDSVEDAAEVGEEVDDEQGHEAEESPLKEMEEESDSEPDEFDDPMPKKYTSITVLSRGPKSAKEVDIPSELKKRGRPRKDK